MGPIQNEVQPQIETTHQDGQSAVAPCVNEAAEHSVAPQHCPSCNQGNQGRSVRGPVKPKYIYTLGNVCFYPKDECIEKEYAQAVASIGGTKGLTETQVLKKVLSQREYSYLIPEFCCVLDIGGMHAHYLIPRCDCGYEPLVEALGEEHQSTHFDLIVGQTIGSHECGGVALPLVMVDKVYSSSVDEFILTIPKNEKLEEARFRNIAKDLFSQIRRKVEEWGDSDAGRALLFAVFRCEHLHQLVAEALERDEPLTRITARPSPLSSGVVVLKFEFTRRDHGFLTNWSMAVNCDCKYPYVLQPLTPSL